MAGLPFVVRHGALSYTAAAGVIFQLTTSAAVPIIIERIELQSANLTSAQSLAILQWGYYATGTSTGGSTPTPLPLNKRLSNSAATGVRINTPTMGTTFTPYDEWQWNTALPFDHVMGLESLKIHVPVSTAFALIFPSSPGTPTISGAIYFTEL